MLSNRRSGQRRDFFFFTNRCCQILGESRQLAVAPTAEFFSAVGRRRGKHVEAARANGFRENAKPLSIGNWIADGKIIAEIGGSSSPGKEQIVSTTPPNDAKDVDPTISELRVTFNMPMAGGFSWTGCGPNFPKTTDRPHWSADHKTCILPVKLKPDWDYRLGLNSPSFKNFRSRLAVKNGFFGNFGLGGRFFSGTLLQFPFLGLRIEGTPPW
jgi:hypothetical protein